MNEKLKLDWMVNGLLAVILLLLVGNYLNGRAANSAFAAGNGGGWETDGVMVTTTAAPNERLVLIDTKKQNIMIYHSRQPGGIGLVGARSYKYDIEIEDTGKKPLGGQGWTYIEAARWFNNK